MKAKEWSLLSFCTIANLINTFYTYKSRGVTNVFVARHRATVGPAVEMRKRVHVSGQNGSNSKKDVGDLHGFKVRGISTIDCLAHFFYTKGCSPYQWAPYLVLDICISYFVVCVLPSIFAARRNVEGACWACERTTNLLQIYGPYAQNPRSINYKLRVAVTWMLMSVLREHCVSVTPEWHDVADAKCFRWLLTSKRPVWGYSYSYTWMESFVGERWKWKNWKRFNEKYIIGKLIIYYMRRPH